MTTALAVRNLRVRFAGEADVVAVGDVSFELSPGEVVGLVGESGCGKSATANAIMGLLAPGCVCADTIRLGERELTEITEREYRRLRGREISMVFQEPLTSLDPVITVGRQVEAVIRRHGLARGGVAREVAAGALRRTGLSDVENLMRRYPHQLSGGMRQRVVIAMAMACKPAVLIADEPTTALDVTTQVQVMAELLRLGRESGTAILLITHDLGLAARACGRIIVMRDGAFVESGPAGQLLARPAHPYTAELIAAVPRLDRRPSETPVKPGETLVRLENRRVSHPVRVNGKRRRLVAVNGVSLDIRRGEILGLVGESGCGKSTLAQSLVGLKPAEGGVMYFGSEPVTGSGSRAWARVRRHVQLVFQDPRASLSPRRSVGQSLMEPLEHFAIGTPGSRPARVAQALSRVGLDPALAPRYPHELSGGQRQRVALARALIAEADLIVADEPLSSLDVSIQARIVLLLRELRREMGFAVLLVSHDLAVVRQLADRVAVMYLGRIVETAPADQLFENPAHPYTRALLAAAAVSGTAEEPGPGAGQAPLPDPEPPSLLTPPPGCVFHTRCPDAMSHCSRVDPPEVQVYPPEAWLNRAVDRFDTHSVNCLLYDDARRENAQWKNVHSESARQEPADHA